MATTFEEPFMSIPFADDGCNDENEEHLDDSNTLSNVGTEMNDISLILSLLSHLLQESFTLVSSKYISIFVYVSDFFKNSF